MSLTDTRMEVRTVSQVASFLVTSDAYYPGWRALIDGQETRLYRADYAIRGLILPPGQHLVEFIYVPKSLYAGATISTLTMLVVIIVAVGPRLRRRKSV